MNHPFELLTDLVDGTLDADGRARVGAHLHTCASCAEDVALAAAGRAAARSLPQVPAPPDLHERVVAEATGRGDARTAGGAPRWYRWAGVAAAAAVVAAIAIALPDVGDRPANELTGQTEDSAGAESVPVSGPSALSAGDVILETRDADYDEEALERLATDAGSAAVEASADSTAFTRRASADAATCVTRSFEGSSRPGRLVRLIAARFKGRDAYIAVYLEGPGAGQPPDTSVVWVVATDGCGLLSVASAQI